eukprot:7384601-Prymnesium_polylepis.1
MSKRPHAVMLGCPSVQAVPQRAKSGGYTVIEAATATTGARERQARRLLFVARAAVERRKQETAGQSATCTAM